MHTDDPRCPECGEPIGMTATYCMHCSADLTDEQAAADTDGDQAWDRAQPERDAVDTSTGNSTDEQLLDPDGIVDNTLTVVVGIVGGLVVGFVGTIVLAFVSGSAWALLFGFVAWLSSTAYLVRQRTVQGAVAKSGYGVALVLLLVPFITLSPVIGVEGGISGRISGFFVLLVFVGIPAAVCAVVGWIAGQFVPESVESGPR